MKAVLLHQCNASSTSFVYIYILWCCVHVQKNYTGHCEGKTLLLSLTKTLEPPDSPVYINTHIHNIQTIFSLNRSSCSQPLIQFVTLLYCNLCTLQLHQSNGPLSFNGKNPFLLPTFHQHISFCTNIPIKFSYETWPVFLLAGQSM